MVNSEKKILRCVGRENSSNFRLTRPLVVGQEAMGLRPLTHAGLLSLLLCVLVILVN